MAKHIEHRHLGDYEGHPILTPLEDAIDHLNEAMRYSSRPRKVAYNKERFELLSSKIKSTIMVIENDLAGKFFQ